MAAPPADHGGIERIADHGRTHETGFAACAAAIAACLRRPPAIAGEETPKRGGTLTYMIPADAPPSFDGHREGTFATVHAAAPFYSVLIRVNPENPASTTDFVCDLCTEMPKPTDGGKTYTFKIRDGVKFHDGSPLTAADVAASWEQIIFPPEGVLSPRQSYYMMVDKIEAPDPTTVVFRLKFATIAFLPALADPFAYIYKKADPRQGPALVREEHHGLGPVQVRLLRDRPVDQRASATRITITRGCPISTASTAIYRRRSRRPGSTRSAPTAPRSSSAACRRRRATS